MANNPANFTDPQGLDVKPDPGVKLPCDPKVLDILRRIDEYFPDNDVRVTSGTRTPEHQEKIRPGSGLGTDGAKISEHVLDRAVDIKVDGVDSNRLADIAREFGATGTKGYAKSNGGHTHFDTRTSSPWHRRH